MFIRHLRMSKWVNMICMMSSRSGRFGCGSDGPDCPPGWGLHEDQTVPLASLFKTPDVGYCSFRMRIRVGSHGGFRTLFLVPCIYDLQRYWYNMLDHGWSNVRCADDGMCFILSDFHVNDIDVFPSSAGRMGVERMMLQGFLPIKTILGLWCFVIDTPLVLIRIVINVINALLWNLARLSDVEAIVYSLSVLEIRWIHLPSTLPGVAGCSESQLSVVLCWL